jgi:nucleotide-binding universal stress UspA family protein
MNTDAPIVVGYDGKPDSLAALSWAVKTASLKGEAVVATTIVDPRESPRGVVWPDSYWEDIEDKAREAFAPWPEVPATIERHVGHLVPRLLESVRAGSMLVLGSKGHTIVGEMMLGSVSQSAARHATAPVVVIRSPQNPGSGRIVVGADGSEASTRALEFACQMAQLTGDKVILLRAWSPTTVVVDRYGHLPSASDVTLADAESALGRIVDSARAVHPAVPIEGEIYSGAAERGLIDASSNASMVVVGSRGHTAVGEALLGSVSRAVLRKAHCPVGVIH